MEDTVLLRNWRQATQSARTWHDKIPLEIMHCGHTWHDNPCPWHDNPCPWHDNCIICSYDITGADFENSLYAFQSEKSQRVQCIIIVNNGNRTEWSPIRFVIIQVINKIRRLRNLIPRTFTLAWVKVLGTRLTTAKWVSDLLITSMIIAELDDTMFCYNFPQK